MKGSSFLSVVLMAAVSAPLYAKDAYDAYHLGQYREAKSSISKLASRGDKRALYYLGLMKINGYGVGKNINAGLEDIEKSAKGGYLHARLYLGQLRLSQNQPQKALYWYKLAAKQGDVAAMLFVASCYKFGYGTKANSTQSRHYLMRAANNGNSLAQYYLAEGYLESSRKSTRRMGFNWLKKSARGGSVLGQLALSRLYEEGRRVTYSPKEATFWLTKAIGNKSIDPNLYIGDYYANAYDLSEREKAISFYEKSLDNPEAKFKLGNLYLQNHFYNNSIEKGVNLITSAAKAGNINAEKALAQFYKAGEYVNASKEQAEFWDKKAAEHQKTALKEKALSWISYDLQDKSIIKKLSPSQVLPKYANKNSVAKGEILLGPKNREITNSEIFGETLEVVTPDGLELITLVESMSPKAQDIKTSNRPFPFYPLKNPKPDQKYFNKLYSKALLGNREAQFELAQYYHFGIGVKKDIPTALSWYFESARQNYVNAEYGLGLIYLQGDGVAQDLKSAKAWLELSSFKGNPYAQYALAYAHQNGVGEAFSEDAINKDAERAKSLYHLASSMNIADAEYNLANLYAAEGLDNLTKKEKIERVAMLGELFESAKEQGISQANEHLPYYYLASGADQDKLQWTYSTLKTKAENGDPKSALLLAIMLDRGLGVSQNKNKALQWYRVAANQNNPIAQFALGSYLYQNASSDAEKNEAHTLLSQSSLNGFAVADFNLAVTFKDANLDHLGLMQKSAANGFDQASLYLADLSVQGVQGLSISEPRATYKRLSNLGNTKASVKLGYMYQQGIDGRQDYKKGVSYYRKAANENNALGQYLLAQSYQFGKGVSINPEKALFWYKKAASNHFSRAYLALGFLYETQFKQYGLARQWYEKALATDQGEANFNLALFYDYGKGNTTVDKQKAFQYYQQAANLGAKKAYFPLAEMFYQGIGTNKQLEKAYLWFGRAKDAGNLKALPMLAMMSENGIGTAKNIPAAIGYYNELAEGGNVDALLSVAKLYKAGDGIAQNLDKAFLYYEKAASSGNKFARYQVAKMRLEGEGVVADKERAIKELEALKKQNYPKAALLLEKVTPAPVDKESDSTQQELNNETVNSQNNSDKKST